MYTTLHTWVECGSEFTAIVSITPVNAAVTTALDGTHYTTDEGYPVSTHIAVALRPYLEENHSRGVAFAQTALADLPELFVKAIREDVDAWAEPGLKFWNRAEVVATPNGVAVVAF